MKKIFAIIIMLVLLLSIKDMTHAQEQAIDLSVSPVFLDITSSPDSSVNKKIRVRNNTTTPLTLLLSVNKLVPEGNEGKVLPKDANPEDKYLSWIEFENEKVTALPREWTDINFKINIPKNSAFGYYYAIHLIQKPSTENSNSPEAKILGEVVIPLLLNVKSPNAKIEAKLTKFSTSSFVNEHLPIEFKAVIENVGNVHVAPRGNIFIRSSNEKDLAILDINQSAGNILPGGTRTFTASWDDGFMVNEIVLDENGKEKLDKNGKPITKLAINWDKLTRIRIGKYEASLIMVYDNGEKDITIEGSTSFWVIPYTIIGSTIFALIITFILIRIVLRAYIRNQIKKAQK